LKTILGTFEKPTDSPNGSCSLALLGTLLCMNVSSCVTSWIIDFAATNHMTSTSQFFHSYNPCPSNRKIVLLSQELETYISPTIILKDVLHVPNLLVNLVSIEKLTNDLFKYITVFLVEFLLCLCLVCPPPSTVDCHRLLLAAIARHRRPQPSIADRRRLPPPVFLQQTNHDMVSHIAKARAAAEELKGLLVCNSVEETTKRIDKLPMVLILRSLHPNYEHVRDQILSSE
ncbi:hypothetical protein CR513_60478, partial [Mucuna pruriens]